MKEKSKSIYYIYILNLFYRLKQYYETEQYVWINI